MNKESYGFGMTWGWVINDRIFIFGWTIPLIVNELISLKEFVIYELTLGYLTTQVTGYGQTIPW